VAPHSGTLVRTAVRIADAAVTVVARRGLDELSVRSVALEAGVAPGTVQHHYRSRADLLRAALDRVVERQFRRVAAGGPHRTALAALRAGLRQLLPLDAGRRDESIVWLAFTAAAASDAAVADRHREVVALMRRTTADTIRQAQRAGEVPVVINAETAAVLVVAATDGLVVHGLSATGRRPSLARLCDEAVDRLLGLAV
jgi:AcrR family transcriptional regulator